MAATRPQVNGLAARAMLRLLLAHVPSSDMFERAFVRAVVREAKSVGTAQARDTAKALLRELYTRLYGIDPAGQRRFRKWVQRALTPSGQAQVGIPGNPIDGVDPDDGFDVSAGDTVT